MLASDVLKSILEFREERDWKQFHSARNLAAALSVEASELLEHFIWASDEQTPQIATECREGIKQEMADIAILLTYLASDLGVDLDDAVRQKLEANRAKYPVEKSKGSNKKYDKL